MTNPSTSDEAFRVDRLHRQAVDCLQSFPKKIDELNELVERHAPKFARSEIFKRRKRRKRKREPRISTIKAPPCSETAAKNSYSLGKCDRHCGIRKRRYYRLEGVRDCDRRRRPGPLGHILAFIIKQLVFCTRKILVEPTRLFTNNVVSTLCQRPNPTNLESSSNTGRSDSTLVSKSDSESNEKLVEVIRPIAIQLISDTTTLKRWLQALVVASRESLPLDLANASRIIETVDYWAYDLFFQLKYLRTKDVPSVTDEVFCVKLKPTVKPGKSDLWRRLTELRDKYNILYEGLRKLDKTDREESKSEGASKSAKSNSQTQSVRMRAREKGERECKALEKV